MKEQKAVHELSQFQNVVVATGGGAPCFYDNMEVMNQTGITLYISPTNKILADRLMKSKSNRPLIAGKNKEQLIGFINDTLSVRNQYYKKAQIIVEADDSTSADDLLTIIKQNL